MADAAFAPVSWVFNGRVLPDLPTLSLNIPGHLAQSPLGFEYEMSGRIHHSKILIVVRQLAPVDIFTLRNAVALDVQASVDLAGFLFGAGLSVDLISAQADNSDWQYFDAFIPALQAPHSGMEVPSDLIMAVAQDTPSQIALSDFREAMRVPLQTGFFCFRAIEAIMQSYKNENEKDAPAWERLRVSLRVEREAIDRVKAHADWARHGRSGSVSDADRVMLLTTTRQVISRYLDFAVAQRAPLSPEKYPLLG